MDLIDYILAKRSRGESSSTGQAAMSEEVQIPMLAEADMLPAVHDTSGAILTDQNGNIILRY